MELVDGITLKQYIEKKGRMETKEAIGVALQVAKGIAAAHENHIIHRDIKPQNIIISRDGKVKVADFGIARAVSAQTAGALAVGSVHYIAPEQAKGLACDARSDIYSFGITMYEMVTGQVPFQGDTSVAVAMAHIQEPVTPPGELNPETGRAMEQIILKCIQKEPGRRYSSVAEVISDLHKAILNPDSDLVPAADGPVDEMGQTKTMSPEEMAKIRRAVVRSVRRRIPRRNRPDRRERARSGSLTAEAVLQKGTASPRRRIKRAETTMSAASLSAS